MDNVRFCVKGDESEGATGCLFDAFSSVCLAWSEVKVSFNQNYRRGYLELNKANNEPADFLYYPYLYTKTTINKTTFTSHIHRKIKSVEDELRSLTAWGLKLQCSLVVWQWILSFFQIAAGWTDCGWLWVLSLSILQTLCRNLPSQMWLMLCSWVAMIYREVLITSCRAFLSWALREPWMLFIVPL